MSSRKIIAVILCLMAYSTAFWGCKPEEQKDWQSVSSDHDTVNGNVDEQETADQTDTESDSETSTSEEVWTPFV